jgi:hypothetical protein
LDNGAEVRQYTRDGDTALHMAIYEGNAKLIWPLLDHGEELKVIDASGRTPLLQAILKGELEVMKILLAAGADRNAQFGPSPGKTALEIDKDNLEKARELASRKSSRKKHFWFRRLVRGAERQTRALESMETILTQPQEVSLNFDTQNQLRGQLKPTSSYALDACKGFQGVVMDFLVGRLKKNLHGHTSVYEVLYGGGPEGVIRPLRLYGMNETENFGGIIFQQIM